MMQNLELDQLIRGTPPGSMMFWSGTCTDPTATCGSCKFFGYQTVVRNEAGNAVSTSKFSSSCLLYKKHCGRDGKPFDPATKACKYFEAKQP
jgi:hypothetical protein